MRVTVVMCVSSDNVQWLDEALASVGHVSDDFIVVADEGIQFHPLLQNNSNIQLRLVESAANPILAANIGAAAAAGDWVGFLSSDDFYDPVGVKTVKDTIEQVHNADPRVAIVGGKVHIFGSLGEHYWPQSGSVDHIQTENNISGAAFFRRKVWWEVQGYSNVRYADWHMWKKMLAAGHRYQFVDIIFHHHRTWSGSIGGQMNYRSDLGHEW